MKVRNRKEHRAADSMAASAPLFMSGAASQWPEAPSSQRSLPGRLGGQPYGSYPLPASAPLLDQAAPFGGGTPFLTGPPLIDQTIPGAPPMGPGGSLPLSAASLGPTPMTMGSLPPPRLASSMPLTMGSVPPPPGSMSMPLAMSQPLTMGSFPPGSMPVTMGSLPPPTLDASRSVTQGSRLLGTDRITVKGEGFKSSQNPQPSTVPLTKSSLMPSTLPESRTKEPSVVSQPTTRPPGSSRSFEPKTIPASQRQEPAEPELPQVDDEIPDHAFQDHAAEDEVEDHILHDFGIDHRDFTNPFTSMSAGLAQVSSKMVLQDEEKKTDRPFGLSEEEHEDYKKKKEEMEVAEKPPEDKVEIAHIEKAHDETRFAKAGRLEKDLLQIRDDQLERRLAVLEHIAAISDRKNGGTGLFSEEQLQLHPEWRGEVSPFTEHFIPMPLGCGHNFHYYNHHTGYYIDKTKIGQREAQLRHLQEQHQHPFIYDLAGKSQPELAEGYWTRDARGWQEDVKQQEKEEREAWREQLAEAEGDTQGRGGGFSQTLIFDGKHSRRHDARMGER